jgi:hypothetical protein
MMVTIEQVKRGLANFVDREIMPHVPMGTLKKTLVGTVIGLFLSNLDKAIANNGGLISMLGITDEEGRIDIDKLADAVRENMSDEGIRVDLDIMGIHLGDMTLRRSDIDVLRNHVVNA